MSDKTKDIILKALLVIDMILFGAWVLFMVIVAFTVTDVVTDEDLVTRIFYTIFFLFLLVAAIFTILLPIFGGLKQKPVKAEKMILPFESYDEVKAFLEKSLQRKGYSRQKPLPILTNGEVIVYAKASKLCVLDCFAIIRIPELSEEILEVANDNITEILTEYYGGRITDTVNMTSVFCVDRITPSFQNLVDSNLEQGVKNGRLVVGISFGGKKIYIARQTDGFAIYRYKQLRKKLFEIMELSVK